MATLRCALFNVGVNLAAIAVAGLLATGIQEWRKAEPEKETVRNAEGITRPLRKSEKPRSSAPRPDGAST